MTDEPYTCPACGHGVDDLPPAVTTTFDRGQWQVENRPDVDDPDECWGDRYVERTKGAHSDQSTHICPECGHEGWNQGWAMDGTPEADDAQ